MNDPHHPTDPTPFPETARSGPSESPAASASTPRPSVEQMFGDVRGAVSSASKREPYPWLAVASLAFTVIWLLWPEGGSVGAVKLKLWALFVIASVALLFVPMLRGAFKLDDFRAWQMAVAGAGCLGFAWVAFLLPSINSNQAFFGTFATVTAALAAWTAPGKPS